MSKKMKFKIVGRNGETVIKEFSSQYEADLYCERLSTDNHYGKDIDDLVYEVCKKTTKEYLPNDEYFSSTELNNIFSNNPNAQVSVVSETEHGGVTSHPAYLSQINKVIVLNWLGGTIIKLQILTKYVGLRVSSAAKRDNIYDE